MSYQHKEGYGSLFRNKKKESEKQPDMRGDCMYKGEELEIAVWTKTDKNGGRFLSLKIQSKKEQYKEGADQARQAASFPDDDLAF